MIGVGMRTWDMDFVYRDCYRISSPFINVSLYVKLVLLMYLREVLQNSFPGFPSAHTSSFFLPGTYKPSPRMSPCGQQQTD